MTTDSLFQSDKDDAEERVCSGRSLLLLDGIPSGFVTGSEFAELWGSDFAAVFGWGNIEVLPVTGLGKRSVDACCSVGDEQDERLSVTLERLASHLRTLADDHAKFLAVCVAMLRRHTDPSHLSVEEVARIEGVSEKTVRNRISSRRYTLEVVPGTRRCGVPVDQVFNRWIDIEVARQFTRGGHDDE